MRYLLILIIVVPAMEIGLLVLSGDLIGVWATIGLIILTGVLGAWLAKREGLRSLEQAREAMSFGQIPGDQIINGLCILVGGVVLLTPGFITDTIGFLLLFPATRTPIKGWIIKRLYKLYRDGKIVFFNNNRRW